MKTKLIFFIFVLVIFSITFSFEVKASVYTNTIETFFELLLNEGEINKVIDNKEIEQNLMKFKKEKKVSEISYDYKNLEFSDDNCLITMGISIKYLKGIMRHGLQFESTFTIAKDSYKIIHTDFFEKSKSTEYFSYFIIIIPISTIAALIHSWRRKKWKWLIVIFFLNIVGAIAYTVYYVIRKNKKN